MIYRTLKGYKYELLNNFQIQVELPDANVGDSFVQIKDGVLYISKDYAWDGPSGPSIDTKSFMRGSLVHDALYQLIREGKLAAKYKAYADTMLRCLCILDGMSKFRAWYVYQAVSKFGGDCVKLNSTPRDTIIEIEEK